MIVIVDYKMGNVGSIFNMLKKIGAQAIVSGDSKDILGADKLILPGVGSFDTGMSHIAQYGLREVLDEKVLRIKTPILGICLGMQLLTRGSEEGQLPGLGWIQGDTKRFVFDQLDQKLKIPHMGWNSVVPTASDNLYYNMDQEAGFYFVHSYHLVCDDVRDVLGWTNYGFKFASSVRKDNIYGTQFHPEKSHRHGLNLLRNFVERT